MASKNTPSPDSLTLQLTNGRAMTQDKERRGIKTTLQQVDSTLMLKRASNMSLLDHVSAILREAMLLVDNDCDTSKQNHSKSDVGDDKSPARHRQ